MAIRNIRIEKTTVTGSEYTIFYERGRQIGSASREIFPEMTRIGIGMGNLTMELILRKDREVERWNEFSYRGGWEGIASDHIRLIRSCFGNHIYLAYDGNYYPVYWEDRNSLKDDALVIGGCSNQTRDNMLATNIIARIRYANRIAMKRMNNADMVTDVMLPLISDSKEFYEYESDYPLPDDFVAAILSLVLVAPWLCPYPHGEVKNKVEEYFKTEITHESRNGVKEEKIYRSNMGKWEEYPKKITMQQDFPVYTLRFIKKREKWETKFFSADKMGICMCLCRYNLPGEKSPEAYLLLKQEYCLSDGKELFRVILSGSRIRVYDSAVQIEEDGIRHDLLAELIVTNRYRNFAEYAVVLYKEVESRMLDAIMTLPMMPIEEIFRQNMFSSSIPYS